MIDARKLLDNPPTLEQVAAVLAVAAPEDALRMGRATDARIEVLGVAQEQVAEGWSTRWQVDALAVVVRWTQEGFRGPREVASTILQAVEGGLVDGEGSAFARQMYVDGAMSAADAATVLRLTTSGRLPRTIASGEL